LATAIYAERGSLFGMKGAQCLETKAAGGFERKVPADYVDDIVGGQHLRYDVFQRILQWVNFMSFSRNNSESESQRPLTFFGISIGLPHRLRTSDISVQTVKNLTKLRR